ncbi:Signal-peptide peptidase, presenilin aspartyl protease [uncultured archaeon]|nr:Signal-peptide peptidase, presenilin aspartyl protease [uncultured archaeon]
MFVITQFIGLYVVNSDPFHIQTEINGTTQTSDNPALSWIQPPQAQSDSDFGTYLGSIIFSFIIAIAIIFLLTKFKIDIILKIWFFVVVVIALFISFYAIFPKYLLFTIGAAILALGLGFIKIFKRNFLVHNITELLIYPGISTMFVAILNLWSVIILLLLISAYDIWAVWHSGIMQKMAKYQINKLKVFSGFFVPYISNKVKLQLKKMKKSKKNKKVKVNIAILGGGDVVFPIITAGVVLLTNTISLPFGLLPSFAFTGGLIPAIFVIAGATLGLALLFIFSERKKFYPAMPFITAGIFLGLILSHILSIMS